MKRRQSTPVKNLIPKIPPEGIGFYATTKRQAEEILRNGFEKHGQPVRVHVIPGSLDELWAVHSDSERMDRVNNTLITAVLHAMTMTERIERPLQGRNFDWSKIRPENYPALVLIKGFHSTRNSGNSLVFFNGHDPEVVTGLHTYGLNIRSSFPRIALAKIIFLSKVQHSNAVKNAKDTMNLVNLVSRKLHKQARRALFSVLG